MEKFMGPRNETARARRRATLRRQLSLTSLPESENEVVYNLSNHFGWRVLGMKHCGEDMFPRVGRDLSEYDANLDPNRKVTYVIFSKEKGKDGKGRKGEQSGRDFSTGRRALTGREHVATQTGLSDTEKNPPKAVTPPPRVVFPDLELEPEVDPTRETPRTRPRRKKNKLIGEPIFYYIPEKDKDTAKDKHRNKSRSHSPKGSKKDSEPITYGDSDQEMTNYVNTAGDNRWRAGADHYKSTEQNLEIKPPVMDKPELNTDKNLKYGNSSFGKRWPPELLPTPDNQYLYLPRHNCYRKPCGSVQRSQNVRSKQLDN